MSSEQMSAFDSDHYFVEQMEAFRERIPREGAAIIEFGGKPFGDYHASRVLPGYEPDLKAEIIQSLVYELGSASLVFAINARDILQMPDGRRLSRRIRGDSLLTYDDELFRITDQARDEFGLPVSDAALTVVPGSLTEQNKDFLGRYIERLRGDFDGVHQLPMIDGYPNGISPSAIVDVLTQAPPIANGRSMIVMSPGGGSGKFSVAVTETAHRLVEGVAPTFIKFETFPVFGLPMTHPLNRAFLAATADLPNELTELSNGLTNYDKDVQNLSLLRQLISRFPELDVSGLRFELPTDMGVNVIERGITDAGLVAHACKEEILRRIRRYEREIIEGNETTETLARTRLYSVDDQQEAS